MDGIRYVWPAELKPSPQNSEVVKFLAPFDPLVWDRQRFEHLWGWAYRFEAYTPPLKRKRGYYAMPLLWKDNVIGWVNVTRDRGDTLDFEPGFMNGLAPATKAFRLAFEEEIENMRTFLSARPVA